MMSKTFWLCALMALPALAQETRPGGTTQTSTTTTTTTVTTRPTPTPTRKLSVVERILQRRTGANTERRGGSDIGGGDIYDSLITWNQKATDIVEEARKEAARIWLEDNDPYAALDVIYEGLEKVLESSDKKHQKISETYLLRYAQRGLDLMDVLRPDKDEPTPKGMEERVVFFDWYMKLIQRVAKELDKVLYVPYITSTGCQDTTCSRIPKVSTKNIELKIVEVSLDVLKELDSRFVGTMAGFTSYYARIGVPEYLKVVSFMLPEVAFDLSGTLFAESYACENGRMAALSKNIQNYIGRRGTSNRQDPSNLNRFTIEFRKIVYGTDNRCNQN